MNYGIISTEVFDRKVKSLAKKYYSLADDLVKFKKELLTNPTMGDDLGNNTRKVRMAIAAKGRGKSGGARVITCSVLVAVEFTKIYLLAIYDKGEQDTISESAIKYLKAKNGL
jgi:hypothetical protein